MDMDGKDWSDCEGTSYDGSDIDMDMDVKDLAGAKAEVKADKYKWKDCIVWKMLPGRNYACSEMCSSEQCKACMQQERG